MSRVAIAVLAAGGSSRMGRPKQLLAFRGRSLLRHATDVALAAECGPVVVVLGANANLLRPELEDLPVTVTVNRDWERGPGTSVGAAVEAVALDPDASAILFTLCDQPFVTPEDLARLVEVHRTSGVPMAAAEYAGSVGVPALFARALFPRLRALKPEAGAKQLLARDPGAVARVPVPAAETDLDTPDDYARCAAADLVPTEERHATEQ